MAGDEQDIAESTDDDKIGADAVTSDDGPIDFPPDRPMGLRYADADVTDESVSDRLAQEEPEVWETEVVEAFDGDLEPITGLDLDDVSAGESTMVGDPADASAEEAALHIEEAPDSA